MRCSHFAKKISKFESNHIINYQRHSKSILNFSEFILLIFCEYTDFLCKVFRIDKLLIAIHWSISNEFSDFCILYFAFLHWLFFLNSFIHWTIWISFCASSCIYQNSTGIWSKDHRQINSPYFPIPFVEFLLISLEIIQIVQIMEIKIKSKKKMNINKIKKLYFISFYKKIVNQPCLPSNNSIHSLLLPSH